MKVAGKTMIRRVSARFFSGFFGAALVFVLSPILLLLVGSSPQEGAYTNVELGFSLLASLGTSCCLVGLISTIYRTLDLPLLGDSLFPWLRIAPETAPAGRPEARERTLPVVAPSLVLPTLISGLGGWVEVVARVPRVEARPFCAA